MTIKPVAQHTLTTGPSSSNFMAYQKTQHFVVVSDDLTDLKLQMSFPKGCIILSQDS
jgi:hypothetical protein